ncbi:MAG: DUF2505 family protein [Deltaproteobacteria bacterium]|jgi:hypothetical protein|nr:DUF2505 family protein [Deltaproteobacteria bacterium]MBT6431527.1 DUF2505 family protein [Deltaproteobacteria bacterium]
MNKTIKHRFPVGKKVFWEKVYFDADYTKGLFLEGMNCESFEVLSESGSVDTKLVRAIKSTPRVEMPKALKKVLGDAISYTESGTYDSSTGRYSFEVKTSALPDKIKISGIYWVEEVGENEVERICELTFEVKVFGVGKLVEQFIAQSYVENQQNADAYTAAWIARELT